MSLPGFTLEAYIKWTHHIKVENQPDANFELRVQEMTGTALIRRPTLTQAEFAPLVAIYEPLRRFVETRLDNFDSEKQTWAEYAEKEFEPCSEYAKQVSDRVNDIWNQQFRDRIKQAPATSGWLQKVDNVAPAMYWESQPSSI